MLVTDRWRRLGRVVLATLWSRALILQAMRFAAVGVVNTLVDFCVFLIAFAYLTSSLVAANTCSWVVAVTGSYVMNSVFTFAAESGRQLMLRAYMRFMASAVLALVANTSALLFAVKVLFLPVVVGKILAIGVSFMVNFSLARFVVFRRREPYGSAV
jgi:putative flippase GtrA